MRTGKLCILIGLVLFALLPCQVFAQEEDPPKPPGCCPSPPPPPGEGGDGLTGGSGTAGPFFYMTDASLAGLGMTRSQYLNELAGALFADPEAKPGVVIPITTQRTLADGTVTTQTGYYQFELSKVAPEVIDSFDLMYLNDGKTYVGISFIRNSGAADR
jgi:hypothetical protein